MAKRVRGRSFPCLLVIAFTACILLSAGFFIPRLITSNAEQQFGPASPNLSTTQHLYLSSLILLQSNDLTQPADPQGTQTSLTIQPGESVPSIIGDLWEAGLIKNPGVFRSYLQYTGQDTLLKAGEFQLSPAMAPIEIAKAIQTSISADVTLSILPGWRIEEIANSLPSTGLNISPEDFLQALQTNPEGYSFSTCQANNSLEGYLFPGSYSVPRQTSLAELLPQILMNFETQVTPEMRSGFTTQGLDLCQAVTLASIVQREAMVKDEMPMIASVFYNRLRSGSVLASDPTVQYALGFNSAQGTWWTNPLTLQDLQVDSPYNTYNVQGLPPGPISNPGLDALKAVAFPAQTSYYYFRSACDGSGRHLFAETYDEHVANACPQP
jgi:peptidoglycan lytic transglycosylase G